jgi:hypothetical protein
MLAASNDCLFAASVDEAHELLAIERFDIALVDIDEIQTCVRRAMQFK